MFYKSNLLILLIISMFTLFEKVDAKYEKLFFDHSIKNINNETIDLNQYKGKTILLVMLLASVALLNNIQAYKIFMKSIKTEVSM